MSRTRWHASPLAGTALVLAGLAALAIPLRELTGRPREAPVPAATTVATSGQSSPAVLRVKLIDPVEKLGIHSIDGRALLETGPLPAGESEHDAIIPLQDGVCELVLSATTGNDETAVFLTVMPDGLPNETRFLTGSGALEETLRFEWHVH